MEVGGRGLWVDGGVTESVAVWDGGPGRCIVDQRTMNREGFGSTASLRKHSASLWWIGLISRPKGHVSSVNLGQWHRSSVSQRSETFSGDARKSRNAGWLLSGCYSHTALSTTKPTAGIVGGRRKRFLNHISALETHATHSWNCLLSPTTNDQPGFARLTHARVPPPAPCPPPPLSFPSTCK